MAASQQTSESAEGGAGWTLLDSVLANQSKRITDPNTITRRITQIDGDNNNEASPAPSGFSVCCIDVGVFSLADLIISRPVMSHNFTS